MNDKDKDQSMSKEDLEAFALMMCSETGRLYTVYPIRDLSPSQYDYIERPVVSLMSIRTTSPVRYKWSDACSAAASLKKTYPFLKEIAIIDESFEYTYMIRRLQIFQQILQVTAIPKYLPTEKLTIVSETSEGVPLVQTHKIANPDHINMRETSILRQDKDLEVHWYDNKEEANRAVKKYIGETGVFKLEVVTPFQFDVKFAGYLRGKCNDFERSKVFRDPHEVWRLSGMRVEIDLKDFGWKDEHEFLSGDNSKDPRKQILFLINKLEEFVDNAENVKRDHVEDTELKMNITDMVEQMNRIIMLIADPQLKDPETHWRKQHKMVIDSIVRKIHENAEKITIDLTKEE